MAKQLANKYGIDAGRWCRIHYCASLMELQRAALSEWKTYIRVLRGEL